MLILKEKIENELMSMSPQLAREIVEVKTTANEGLIKFRNNSRIIVVTANDSARGHRSTVNIYEEKRLLDKNILDSVISPFLIPRQTPYLKKAEYKQYKQDPVQLSISSAWYKSDEYFWNDIRLTGQEMLNNRDFKQICLGFDYYLALYHGLKTQSQMQQERLKSDEVSFAIEYLNIMYDSEGAFLTYDLFQNNRKLKKALYPRSSEEIAGGKIVKRLQKEDGVIRILSCDIAMSSGNANDNSIYTLAEMIPMKGYYEVRVCYMESHNGKLATEQALRIRRLVADFDVDVVVLDCMTIGLPVLDLLGTQLVDEETGEEYEALSAYNDEDLRARCRFQKSLPIIFGMRANAQLNNDMIVQMKTMLQQGKVKFLLSENDAEGFLSKTNKSCFENPSELSKKQDLLMPYVQTSLAVNECIQLETELRSGRIAVKERSGMRKDRYSSLLYLLWVASLLEKERLKDDTDEDFDITEIFKIARQPVIRMK